MKVGVSPKLRDCFPDLRCVTEHPSAFFDLTLVLVSEENERWVRRSERRLRPFYCSDAGHAEKVLDDLRQITGGKIE